MMHRRPRTGPGSARRGSSGFGLAGSRGEQPPDSSPLPIACRVTAHFRISGGGGEPGGSRGGPDEFSGSPTPSVCA